MKSATLQVNRWNQRRSDEVAQTQKEKCSRFLSLGAPSPFSDVVHSLEELQKLGKENGTTGRMGCQDVEREAGGHMTDYVNRKTGKGVFKEGEGGAERRIVSYNWSERRNQEGGR